MPKVSATKENASFEVSLKVILKNKMGEILLLKMPEHGSSMPGYYDLLGGRIREKEIRAPFRKILTRELREELGNKVKYKVKEVPVAIGHHYYFSKLKQKTQYILWGFLRHYIEAGKLRFLQSMRAISG